MVAQLTLLAALALLATTGACDDVEAGADRLRARGAEALERFEVERVRVEAELEQRFEQASAELEQLKGVGEEHLAELQRELEEQREVARAKLAELRSAGEEAWEGALEDARAEVEELGKRSSEALSGD